MYANIRGSVMQFGWFQIKYENTRIENRENTGVKTSTPCMPGRARLQARPPCVWVLRGILLRTPQEFLSPLGVGGRRLGHGLWKAAISRGPQPRHIYGVSEQVMSFQPRTQLSSPAHPRPYPWRQIGWLGSTGSCQQKKNLDVQKLCPYWL